MVWEGNLIVQHVKRREKLVAHFAFRIGRERYCLPVAVVQRCYPACRISGWNPDHPWRLGWFALQGRLIPLINSRKVLSLPVVALAPEQYFLLLEVKGKEAALWIDDVFGLMEFSPGDCVPQVEGKQFKRCWMQQDLVYMELNPDLFYRWLQEETES